MKILINGGYLVAFNGKEHCLIQDGVVVLEDDRIIHVGKSYKGAVDRTIDAKGKLISPGFVNIHALASICITHLRLDGFRAGLSVSKDYVVGGVGNLDLIGEDLSTSALFCIVELLKGGATTIVPITAMAPSRWESPRKQAEVLATTAGELGARAYISHNYRSGVKYWDKDGAIHYNWNEEAGLKGLARAIRFSDKIDGSYNDRIRSMLFPYQFDACSVEILKKTKEAAIERNQLIHMHTAQSLFEFYETLRRYGRTPIQYLYNTGFLDSNVILTHVLYTTLNPQCGFPKYDTRDIELLSKSKATVAHTPVIYSRGGKLLQSLGQYLKIGVNISIGTDAFPMDMITEMRHAAIMGKIADQDPLSVTARDVFNAATLGGANALGRKDLGRLEPGAKADIVIVDLTNLHLALIDDPIKTLVYMASQKDIDMVIIDGRILVEGGHVSMIDEKKLSIKANEVNQKQKMAFIRQNPMGRSAEELFPPSFKDYKNPK